MARSIDREGIIVRNTIMNKKEIKRKKKRKKEKPVVIHHGSSFNLIRVSFYQPSR